MSSAVRECHSCATFRALINVLPPVHDRSIVAEKVSCPHRIMVSSAAGSRQGAQVRRDRPSSRRPSNEPTSGQRANAESQSGGRTSERACHSREARDQPAGAVSPCVSATARWAAASSRRPRARLRPARPRANPGKGGHGRVAGGVAQARRRADAAGPKVCPGAPSLARVAARSRATAKAGRNQHIRGCQWKIRSAVLRSRESP